MKSKALTTQFLLMVMFILFTNGCEKGNDISVIPALSTAVVTDYTQTTAMSGGVITSDGGATITKRGVCWSTSETPTIDNSKTEDGTGVGDFTSSITGLNPNTTYFVRAYATNSVGTGYGNTLSFTTEQSNNESSFTDPRDGNIYQVITIGNQVWMSENLIYLPSVAGPASGSLTTPYYYVYGYSGTDVSEAKATAEYSIYGVLYNWSAAENACPTGWHLPSDAEWSELTYYLGGEWIAGGKLKENGTSHWAYPNAGSTNETGFTALPGGNRYSNGTFGSIGNFGDWFSVIENYDPIAMENVLVPLSRGISYNSSSVDINHNYMKDSGLSIRCIRD